MSHANVSTSSSWKLESSSTTHVPASTVSAISLSGVCSLPASTTSTPAAANIAPSRRTVVVFPFVPVTPSTGLPGRSRQPSSISLQTGMPRERADSTRVGRVRADDAVDGRVRQRQHRQLPEEVVEPRVGELLQQTLQLVDRRLEDDDFVVAVEGRERVARRLRSQHADDAAQLWWK